MKKTILIIVNILCLMTILTQTCCAYLDPATTSYVIQIIAGVVIACGAAIGIFWNKITRKFRKKSDIEEKSQNKATASDSETGKVITAEDLLDDE